MVTIALAVLLGGYGLFYVAASNLAHGPGNGVGFLEAFGLKSPGGAPVGSPASAGSRPAAPGSKPGHDVASANAAEQSQRTKGTP